MLTTQVFSIFNFVLFINVFFFKFQLFVLNLLERQIQSFALFSVLQNQLSHSLTFIQLLTLTKIYYLIKACCGSHRPWKKPCPAQLRSFQKKNGSFLDFSRNYLILYIQKNTSIVPLVTFIQNLKMFTYIHWYIHTLIILSYSFYKYMFLHNIGMFSSSVFNSTRKAFLQRFLASFLRNLIFLSSRREFLKSGNLICNLSTRCIDHTKTWNLFCSYDSTSRLHSYLSP